MSCWVQGRNSPQEDVEGEHCPFPQPGSRGTRKSQAGKGAGRLVLRVTDPQPTWTLPEVCFADLLGVSHAIKLTAEVTVTVSYSCEPTVSIVDGGLDRPRRSITSILHFPAALKMASSPAPTSTLSSHPWSVRARLPPLLSQGLLPHLSR